MTADQRLRIGGWAALLVAIVLPIQFVAAFVWPATSDPVVINGILVLEVLGMVATIAAVVGLDRLFGPFDQRRARRVLVIGLVGSVLSLAVLFADVTGSVAMVVGGSVPRFGPIGVLIVAARILVALWFVGGGLILLSESRDMIRIGWSAVIGGAGMILSAVASAVRFGGTPGVTGTALIDWFHLIGLFVIIYLVRVWRLVVGGRLPGPGVV